MSNLLSPRRFTIVDCIILPGEWRKQLHPTNSRLTLPFCHHINTALDRLIYVSSCQSYCQMSTVDLLLSLSCLSTGSLAVKPSRMKPLFFLALLFLQLGIPCHSACLVFEKSTQPIPLITRHVANQTPFLVIFDCLFCVHTAVPQSMRCRWMEVRSVGRLAACIAAGLMLLSGNIFTGCTGSHHQDRFPHCYYRLFCRYRKSKIFKHKNNNECLTAPRAFSQRVRLA